MWGDRWLVLAFEGSTQNQLPDSGHRRVVNWCFSLGKDTVIAWWFVKDLTDGPAVRVEVSDCAVKHLPFAPDGTAFHPPGTFLGPSKNSHCCYRLRF